jgi:hypothetical protein
LKIAQITVGDHRVEARRRGKNAAQQIQVDGSKLNSFLELPLERGPGVISLSLNPSSAAVSVSQMDGKTVAVTGPQFELTPGSYRVTARAPHFEDRTEIIKVMPEQTTTLNWALSPLKASAEPVQSVTLNGWDKRAWEYDSTHTAIVHKKSGISLFELQRGPGRYVFTVSLDELGPHGKNDIEWVAGYLGRQDYLLFSISRDGFESFLIQNGNKVKHGDPLPVPKLKQYSIAVEIQPRRVVTYLYDGSKWQALQDWNNVLAQLDQGQFGFKNRLTVNRFQVASRQ